MSRTGVDMECPYSNSGVSIQKSNGRHGGVTI